MTMKYSSPDNLVEVIVDPQFGGDIVKLAQTHPVWIIDSRANSPLIDLAWALGEADCPYEVSRCRLPNEDSRLENLESIMGELDDHYNGSYIMRVHGLAITEATLLLLETSFFELRDRGEDWFVAATLPEHLTLIRV